MTVLENDTGTHIDSPFGSFATLCGESTYSGRHIEGCELGGNWKDCPACLGIHQATDKPVTCPRCAAIYNHCRGRSRIEFAIKAEKPKRKSRKPV